MPKRTQTFMVLIPPHLEEIWPHFLDHRKLKKSPLTDFGQGLCIKKLERLAPGDHDTQIQIVEQTIERGWVGLFQLAHDSANAEDEAARLNRKLGRA